MPTDPLVSIVIPVHNARRYLPATLDAALAQTYTLCEVIVVDDGSTDGSGDLACERCGDRVRILHQDNQGPSAARNAGTRAARGELVAYCDADDHLLPDKVARCVAVLQDRPAVALVCTRWEDVDEDTGLAVRRPSGELPSGDVFCALLAQNFVGTSTVTVRRSAVLEAGGFDESMTVAEDWDLWLRLADRYPFGAVDAVLMRKHVRHGGLHNNPVGMATGRLTAIQHARALAKRRTCLDDHAYDRLEAGRWHQLAMVTWAAGRRAEARSALRAAIRLDPSGSRLRRLYAILSLVLPARWVVGPVERLLREPS